MFDMDHAAWSSPDDWKAARERAGRKGEQGDDAKEIVFCDACLYELIERKAVQMEEAERTERLEGYKEEYQKLLAWRR